MCQILLSIVRAQLFLGIFLLICPELVPTLRSQHMLELRYEDKIRIREAFMINQKYGDEVWKGLRYIPFVISLVTEDFEYLINHPYPSDDFVRIGFDTILEANVAYRNRQYSPYLLATFPAVNGVPTIVVGTPENTDLTSTEWIITLLHEHFHQWQMSDTNYYGAVNNLDLSGDDQSGNWMLDYSFPYDEPLVIEAYRSYVYSLSQAIQSKQGRPFAKTFRRYLTARRQLHKSLAPRDYDYFSFQLWQEGIARFTEYDLLSKMKNYLP
ncbi:MAG: hypothetical protein OEQ53_11235, partial [Saprospiraceae bacterium]|nr:hypothetical protein [Saprospiraceae bacterium]